MIEDNSQYNIFDIGFNKFLLKDSYLGLSDSLGLPSSLNSIFNEIAPSQLASGEFTGNMTMVTGLLKSSNYVSGSAGWNIEYGGSAEFSDITIYGGTGIGNLDDAGALAVLDEVGASNCDTTIISGGKIITGLLTADNINTGTLTGRTVRTSSGTTRVEMTASDNTLKIYESGNLRVALGSGVITFLTASEVGSGEIYGYGTNQLGFNVSGSGDYIMNASGLEPLNNNVRDLGSSSVKWKNLYIAGDINLPTSTGDVTGDLIPTSSNFYDLGSSSYAWGLCYLGQTRTRTLYPASDDTYDLGTSSLGWRNLYLSGDIDCDGFVDINEYASIHGVLYMNNQQVRDVADPTSDQHAATKKWVEDNFVAS